MKHKLTHDKTLSSKCASVEARRLFWSPLRLQLSVFWPISIGIPRRASDSLLPDINLPFLLCCHSSLSIHREYMILVVSVMERSSLSVLWAVFFDWLTCCGKKFRPSVCDFCILKAMIPVILLFCLSVLFYTSVSLQQGVIVAGGEEYLIEPLVSPDNQTRTERGERAEGRPHVVYKRSSLRHQYKGQSCGVIGERRDILVFLVAAVWSRLEE